MEATVSDCIISGEDMGLLKSHYSAIGEILDKYGVGLEQFCDIKPEVEKKPYERPAEVEYEHCDWLTIGHMAELVFERYGHADEPGEVKVKFMTARLKARKFLTYREGIGCRMYSLTEAGKAAKWLRVPECARTEFSSAEVWFIKAGMNAMLRDL